MRSRSLIAVSLALALPAHADPPATPPSRCHDAVPLYFANSIYAGAESPPHAYGGGIRLELGARVRWCDTAMGDVALRMGLVVQLGTFGGIAGFAVEPTFAPTRDDAFSFGPRVGIQLGIDGNRPTLYGGARVHYGMVFAGLDAIVDTGPRALGASAVVGLENRAGAIALPVELLLGVVVAFAALGSSVDRT